MIRRRRRGQEIAFGFDSFLDIVANVVGIIIRMILVVWVGARAYTSLHFPPRPPASAESPADAADPLERELAEHRHELAQAQDRLLEQLRQLDQIKNAQASPLRELADLAARRQALAQERAGLQRQGMEAEQRVRSAAASLDELRQRERRLKEEIAALEKEAPPKPPVLGRGLQTTPQRAPPKQVFRYRVPVSRPVQTEELIFECRGGRVTFIDVGALLDEVRRSLRDKAEALRTRWEVEDVAGPIGPFRLRYTVERQRDFAFAVPDAYASFSYGVSAWQIEPVVPLRGETLEAALAPGSEFRQIVDVLDPQHTAVTFCVYPDSFALYRQLRDYLYRRDLVVAGRPLPEGALIAGSRHGTLSRGQ
ncbi:MAG TPA: hypothetical protein VNK04_05200 [Gemmataceae bacterium]|nr:hypothetical protein [Gemmataceae bacterium]